MEEEHGEVSLKFDDNKLFVTSEFCENQQQRVIGSGELSFDRLMSALKELYPGAPNDLILKVMIVLYVLIQFSTGTTRNLSTLVLIGI